MFKKTLILFILGIMFSACGFMYKNQGISFFYNKKENFLVVGSYDSALSVYKIKMKILDSHTMQMDVYKKFITKKTPNNLGPLTLWKIQLPDSISEIKCGKKMIQIADLYEFDFTIDDPFIEVYPDKFPYVAK